MGIRYAVMFGAGLACNVWGILLSNVTHGAAHTFGLLFLALGILLTATVMLARPGFWKDPRLGRVAGITFFALAIAPLAVGAVFFPPQPGESVTITATACMAQSTVMTLELEADVPAHHGLQQQAGTAGPVASDAVDPRGASHVVAVVAWDADVDVTVGLEVRRDGAWEHVASERLSAGQTFATPRYDLGDAMRLTFSVDAMVHDGFAVHADVELLADAPCA